MLKKYGNLNVPCGIKCLHVWDGNGRWVNETWMPFLTGRSLNKLSFFTLKKSSARPIASGQSFVRLV